MSTKPKYTLTIVYMVYYAELVIKINNILFPTPTTNTYIIKVKLS